MIIELSPQQKRQLFDRSQFRAELTLVSQPSLAYRKCLEQADNLMNQWFDENEPIQMLVAGRAWLIDQALTPAWDHLIGQESDDIAVSGYGRGELHPHYDIDILILLHSESGKRHQRAIEQFLTLLWDCNLEVGSSVCTIAEYAFEGAADLTIITTMIESRLLSEPRTVCKNEGSYSIRAVEKYHGWYLFGDLESAIGIMCFYRFVSYCQKLKIC